MPRCETQKKPGATDGTVPENGDTKRACPSRIRPGATSWLQAADVLDFDTLDGVEFVETVEEEDDAVHTRCLGGTHKPSPDPTIFERCRSQGDGHTMLEDIDDVRVDRAGNPIDRGGRLAGDAIDTAGLHGRIQQRPLGVARVQ